MYMFPTILCRTLSWWYLELLSLDGVCFARMSVLEHAQACGQGKPFGGHTDPAIGALFSVAASTIARVARFSVEKALLLFSWPEYTP